MKCDSCRAASIEVSEDSAPKTLYWATVAGTHLCPGCQSCDVCGNHDCVQRGNSLLCADHDDDYWKR